MSPLQKDLIHFIPKARLLNKNHSRQLLYHDTILKDNI